MDPRIFNHLLDALMLDHCRLVDIGARGGPDRRWLLFGDRLKVVASEPDAAECQRLAETFADTQSQYLPVGISDRPGNVTLNVCRDPGKSSCYMPNYSFLKRFPEVERFDVVETREMAVDSLDCFFSGGPASEVDFIKLDVQGSEKDIAHGGREALSKAFGIEIEVEFTELYVNQPLFADIDPILRSLGFSFFDLRPFYWKRTRQAVRGSGQVIFADALYFKDPIATRTVPENPAAAVAICCLYGKFDFAFELARFFRDRSVYGPDQYRRIEKALEKIAVFSVPWSRVRGSLRLARFFESISQALKNAYWSRCDERW